MSQIAMLNEVPDIVGKAKKFAVGKHKNQKRRDGITSFSSHLEGVVNRLKNLGVTNEEILSAGWLHDVIEYTDTTFEEINEVFGNTISVLVLALTKDLNLSNKERELQYIQQLKILTPQSRIIKFCDISANLKEISNSSLSKSQKNKQVRKLFHYLRIIKTGLSDLKPNYPRFQELMEGINSTGKKFHQRPINI